MVAKIRIGGLPMMSVTPALLEGSVLPSPGEGGCFCTSLSNDTEHKEESPVVSSVAFLPRSRTFKSCRSSESCLGEAVVRAGASGVSGNYPEMEVSFYPPTWESRRREGSDLSELN